VIVRWGLAELEPLLRELDVRQPFFVASPRWEERDLGTDVFARWSEVPSHRIEDAAAAARGADAVLALGGGSAIDLGKAISAATELPLISVPTTYAGAEWTGFFGVRDPDRRMHGGGAGAHLAGIVYEPELTLELPRAETVGTAMNALAHCAEALYVRDHNAAADARALVGAQLIGEHLPRVAERPHDLDERTKLLEGAAAGGEALGLSGLALGHAMAQALGGRYGLPHGALNAICLPPALRFNEELAGAAIHRYGEALGTDDPIGRTRELGTLGGFERLRDLGVPESELSEVAAAAAERAGAKANPRPASPDEIEELLRSVW
jgi:maleylacetate reductase